MIESEHIIRLDIHDSSYQKKLNIIRNDTCRKLIIKLYEDGKPFSIPDGCKAKFVARKRDDTSVFNECDIENNCIVYELTTQTTAVAGTVNCEIRLNDENDELITSPHFSLFVMPSVYVDGDVEEASKDEIDALSNLLTTLEDSLEAGKFNGVGIESIKQTASASISDGQNILTITLTDGTRAVFIVKNGSKGSKGNDGKSAYEYAQDGGYEGTEAEFAVKLAKSVPKYVKDEAEAVAEKVLSTRNAHSFVFGAISDIHSTGSDASTLHAGQGMYEIDKLTNLDACLNLGDGIDSYFENANADSFLHIRKCLHSIQRDIPYIQMQVNHDQLKTDTTEDAQQKYFAYIGANNVGTVTDWDNRFRNYGYRDFPDQRMRVIYLNSVDVSEGENTDDCWLTAMQLSWFINTALDFSGKDGWSFIVGCHHPLNWWYMDNLLTILDAYKGKSSGSVTVDDTAVSYDFTNATAEFIAHFHGHIHNFRVETLGTNGVLSITIPNACFGRNNEYGTQYDESMAADYGDADENGNQRQFNKTTRTAEDTAFNVVVIDRDNQKIHCFNYGAGIDRVVDFAGVVDPDEPIVPDEPEEIVNILDTIGYTDGQRCRTSGISLGALAGATAFGWYDCSNLTPSDVIRIYLPNGIPTAETNAYAAHCTSADETTSTSMGMYTQSSFHPFTSIFNDCSYSNNILTLTGRNMDDTSRTKFRLSAQANGADCIMTLNQEIPIN